MDSAAIKNISQPTLPLYSPVPLFCTPLIVKTIKTKRISPIATFAINNAEIVITP